MPAIDRAAPPVVSASETLEDSVEQSGTFPRPDPNQRLSATLWGLDLNARLPLVISREGLVAVPGTLARVAEFVSTEFSSLVEESAPVTSACTAQAKRWFLGTASDLIELQHEGRTVGVLIGAPEDWASYYIRVFAVLQRYRRPPLLRRFVRECLYEPLRAHGVERVVADTSPANIGMARTFSEQHFHVTGHHLSDRWGPLVRYTKFLDAGSEAAFQKRFVGIAPANSNRRKEDAP
jgi:hypothetical protein